MDEEEILHVVDTQPPDTISNSDLFILEDELTNVPDERRETVLSSVTKISQSTEESFPLTEAILPYLIFSRYASLPSHVILYELLIERVNESDYEKIRTYNLNDGQTAVVRDVAHTAGIEIQAANFPSNYFDPKSLLSRRVLLHFVDQLFSLIVATALYRNSNRKEFLCFTSSPSRNEASVLNKLEGNTAAITTSVTVSRYIKNKPKYTTDDVDIRPLNTYTSLSLLGKQISLLAWLFSQYRTNEWEMESHLRDGLEDELGVQMNATVHYTSSIAIENSIRYVLMYYLFERAIQTENTEGIMVLTDNPKGRFALAASEGKDVDRYYLPHSITCGNEILPAQKDTVQFVEGDYAIDYLENSPLKGQLPQLMASGRPVLEEMVSNSEPKSDRSIDDFRILVATQPFADRKRVKFVESVLEAIDGVRDEYEVIIKIHPMEDKEFYEESFNSHELRKKISIEEGDIEPVILESDITVTVNSNVGLESIILGSCTISYNEWIPQLSVFPYIKEGPIPLAQEPVELRQIFKTISDGEYDKLVKSQSEFFYLNFRHDKCSQNIGGIINDRQWE